MDNYLSKLTKIIFFVIFVFSIVLGGIYLYRSEGGIFNRKEGGPGSNVSETQRELLIESLFPELEVTQVDGNLVDSFENIGVWNEGMAISDSSGLLVKPKIIRIVITDKEQQYFKIVDEEDNVVTSLGIKYNDSNNEVVWDVHIRSEVFLEMSQDELSEGLGFMLTKYAYFLTGGKVGTESIYDLIGEFGDWESNYIGDKRLLEVIKR
jgi:hypothetical protein